jgi:A/G-specific adenine glycosylase
MTRVEGPGLPTGLSEQSRGEFRTRLMEWYGREARVLPWRGVRDPYWTWVSEVMLQQTRVAAVLEHYGEFLRRFPDVKALAAAREEEVLAAWSGLGYYRRARMLHRAAQFCALELGEGIPETAVELRALPGVGEYTAAAIASIAFGESVAVVDGNVERVLLRVTGRAEDASAKGRAFIRERAALLVPAKVFTDERNDAGDHNQAMMELGATICLPKGPLCLQCPVLDLCRTRGEHGTGPRGKQKTQRVACLLALREGAGGREVLLETRAVQASLMPGMVELPGLPLDAVKRREPVLRVKHSITNTNYAVEVFAGESLLAAVPARAETLGWFGAGRLGELALTGLARKVLLRIGVMTKRGRGSAAGRN